MLTAAYSTTLADSCYSEDVYNELRGALMDRLNDKETLIRAHAVIALSKLIGSEDPDDAEQGEQTILQTLLEVISTDPAAYVTVFPKIY
jgi:condensin complex subunit 3